MEIEVVKMGYDWYSCRAKSGKTYIASKLTDLKEWAIDGDDNQEEHYLPGLTIKNLKAWLANN